MSGVETPRGLSSALSERELSNTEKRLKWTLGGTGNANDGRDSATIDRLTEGV